MNELIIKSRNDREVSLKKIGIIGNKNNEEIQNALNEISVAVSEEGLDNTVISTDSPDPDITFAITAGGDGTILKTARSYAKYHVPVFGINLGRLGFLAQSSKFDIKDSLKKIIRGKFKVEERLMLRANPGKIDALNDVVIKGDNFSRTARMYVSVNGNIVCNYLADGLIISTPTGSTAYNISAGGPILVPRLNAFIIVPICPHTLNARPLVIPSNEKIEITSADNIRKLKMSADGQNIFSVPENSPIKIKKNRDKAKLILLEDQSFYSVLKEKLYWGVSGKNNTTRIN